MKKNLSTIFLLLGTIIGAGFCSGKEICVYFAKFGFASLFFLPFYFVIYYFLFKLFLTLGSKKDYSNFSHFNSEYGKNNFFDVVLGLTYVVFSSAMFACINEMSQLYFGNFVSIFILIFTFLFCVFMLVKDFGKLKILNSILIPIVITIILIICIFSLFNIGTKPQLSFVRSDAMIFFTPIIYACQGIALSYYIMIKAGSGLSKKSIKTISFVSVLILTIILALAIVVFNLFPQVLNEPLPFVMLSFSLGFPFDLLFAPVLFFAILTTLLSSTRALFDYLEQFIKKKFLRAILTCAVTLLLSFLGFSSIVESLYPVIGCFGVIIVLRILFFKYNKNNGFKNPKKNKKCAKIK